MKKNVLFLMLAVSLCGFAASQNIGPYQFSIKTHKKFSAQAKTMADNNRFLCFTFNKEVRQDGKYLWDKTYDVFIDYDNDNLVMICDHEFDNYYLVTNDSAMNIDKENRDLTIFKKRSKSSAFYDVGVENFISQIRGVDYYLKPLKKHCRMKHSDLLVESCDTIIRGTSFTKYTGHSGISYLYNEDTRRYDIPHDDISLAYVNNETNYLDSVYTTNITNNGFKSEIIIKIIHVSNDNMYPFIDSIFNFTNKSYTGYSVHDNLNPPASILGTANKNLNDVALDFPLVSLNGDTTTIRKESGWLFLDFWFMGCSPCVESFQKIKHEQDSLGHRILESEGIKMLLINVFSNNAELIMEKMEKYNINDIIYTAKGFRKIYDASPCPYIILVSPDKQKVYEVAGEVGDCYQELLKAKREYEMNIKH